MKTEVYSWRLKSERKAALEEIARKRSRAVSDLLDEAVDQ
jgi:predicted transcriptional regulator